MFEVFNGEGALRGIPDDIELKSIRLWGENRDFQKGMFFALAAMILLLGAFLYMAFRKPRDAAAFESQMKEAAQIIRKGLDQIDSGLDWLNDAAVILGDTPMEDKIRSFIDSFEALAVDLKMLNKHYERGERE
jgi:hypothetical protein